MKPIKIKYTTCVKKFKGWLLKLQEDENKQLKDRVFGFVLWLLTIKY